MLRKSGSIPDSMIIAVSTRGVFRVEQVEASTNSTSSTKYVLLSAAQDDEYAQASPNGSYFTLGHLQRDHELGRQ